MKLSIITVNLNNRDGLKRTIDSVINQSFTDYEWIVIDGGSTDGSRELIEQYQDHFTYWCSEPDKGIYNAMNKGISHAKGQWLQFLNSGDWLYESTTLEMVFAKEYDADVLYGDAACPKSDGFSIWKSPSDITVSFLYEYAICHQSMFFQRRIFEFHSYDENNKICSDWVLYYKLAIENYIMQYIPLIVSTYEGNGISEKEFNYATYERQKILEEITPFHLRKDLIKLCDARKKEQFINSHRTYRMIFNIAKLKIKTAHKILSIIERIRFFFKTHLCTHHNA